MKVWRLEVAFAMTGDFAAVSDSVVSVVGRESDDGGAGASKYGCGMRDMGWECGSEFEARGLAAKVHNTFPTMVAEVVCHDRDPVV